MVTLCTTRFNVQTLYIMPTECIYVFSINMCLGTAITFCSAFSDWFCNTFYCAVRTECLNIIQDNFRLQRVNHVFYFVIFEKEPCKMYSNVGASTHFDRIGFACLLLMWDWECYVCFYPTRPMSPVTLGVSNFRMELRNTHSKWLCWKRKKGNVSYLVWIHSVVFVLPCESTRFARLLL
jgi:hypothetical protein